MSITDAQRAEAQAALAALKTELEKALASMAESTATVDLSTPQR